ncbi:RbsD/FucU domain-containing protein [uncultured Cohaesibacter sp.]|uniref:RbsD/FucU family protein n=1 Tax=uncultured Cohaesibacter sp. TaxID=1002546 RepID=UPI0029C9ABEE|nr:RbsD/FucU domain-containing protein [uncultured Cohaesibacter sp.]
MLRNINPLLSPDLLHILAAMGHGDNLVIADANFPGEQIARANGCRYIRLDGILATDILKAVLELMPLDDFVKDPAYVMEVVGDAAQVPPVVTEFQTVIDEVADNPAPIAAVERFAFYDMSKQSYAIIQSGERRLYGNIIVKKGVVRL